MFNEIVGKVCAIPQNYPLITGFSVAMLGLSHWGYDPVGIMNWGFGPLTVGNVAGSLAVAVGGCMTVEVIKGMVA
jgi:hypothetical protein|tara:strand:- start:660 stop:884 length:225 start_codon:yes stop_codon:yes gene_type:complete